MGPTSSLRGRPRLGSVPRACTVYGHHRRSDPDGGLERGRQGPAGAGVPRRRPADPWSVRPADRAGAVATADDVADAARPSVIVLDSRPPRSRGRLVRDRRGRRRPRRDGPLGGPARGPHAVGRKRQWEPIAAGPPRRTAAAASALALAGIRRRGVRAAAYCGVGISASALLFGIGPALRTFGSTTPRGTNGAATIRPVARGPLVTTSGRRHERRRPRSPRRAHGSPPPRPRQRKPSAGESAQADPSAASGARWSSPRAIVPAHHGVVRGGDQPVVIRSPTTGVAHPPDVDGGSARPTKSPCRTRPPRRDRPPAASDRARDVVAVQGTHLRRGVSRAARPPGRRRDPDVQQGRHGRQRPVGRGPRTRVRVARCANHGCHPHADSDVYVVEPRPQTSTPRANGGPGRRSDPSSSADTTSSRAAVNAYRVVFAAFGTMRKRSSPVGSDLGRDAITRRRSTPCRIGPRTAIFDACS